MDRRSWNVVGNLWRTWNQKWIYLSVRPSVYSSDYYWWPWLNNGSSCKEINLSHMAFFLLRDRKSQGPSLPHFLIFRIFFQNFELVENLNKLGSFRTSVEMLLLLLYSYNMRVNSSYWWQSIVYQVIHTVAKDKRKRERDRGTVSYYLDIGS